MVKKCKNNQVIVYSSSEMYYILESLEDAGENAKKSCDYLDPFSSKIQTYFCRPVILSLQL